MLILLPCSLLALMLLDDTSGFQNCFHRNQKPSLVGMSIPLLTTKNSARAATHTSRTALFDRSLIDMEGDPLEDDRRQTNPRLNEKTNSPFVRNVEGAKKRLVPHQKKGSGSSPLTAEDQQQQHSKRRLVRPQTSSNANERKATTSVSAGVNMELRDPKERVLVRHATASSAYGVNDFKGKKKKIIKPWSSGRKKKKNRQNNTGGIAREAYGEELEIELKNRPKKKRLVMARTNSSDGNQDAAKALISGGSKANPLAAEDIAEERRSRKYRRVDDDDDDDSFDDDIDEEPNLFRSSSSIAKETEGDASNGPTLVRLSSSIIRQAGDDNEEPNLVRLSSSIVREPDEDGKDEPNLVRLESSMVKEPRKSFEEKLKYTRYGTSEEEENKQKEQRFVRAVPASQESTSKEPKLVRPNIVKAQVERPKLMRPNIVKVKAEGPKLVRPNVFRAKAKGPKLVRANIQKEKIPRPNLVRPKITPDGMDVGNGTSTDGPPLVRPTSSTIKMKDLQAEDFMYGAKASITSPTAVSMDSKPLKYVKGLTSTNDDPMENLTDGEKEDATMSTDVSVENSKRGEDVLIPVSTDNNSMDNLMYGAKQATSSPIAVPLKIKSKKKVVSTVENITEDSMYDSDDSIQVGNSQAAVPIQTKPKVPMKPQPFVRNAIDDLMYGHQRSTTPPTAVKIETNPTKFVKSETGASRSSIEEDPSKVNTLMSSATIYPDGDKRNKINQRRLVRASTPKINTVPYDLKTNKNKRDKANPKQKRYVKPSTSAMDDVTDWDAANPTSTTTNPTFVKPIRNKVGVASHNFYGNNDRGENEGGGNKKYVQPSTSLMDNVPDWDAVQPATTTSNPNILNVDVPKLKKEVEYKSKEKEKSDAMTEKPKIKTYVQPSTSLMDNVPDWDAVQPATTTSNPNVLNVDAPKLKKEVEYKSKDKMSDVMTEKTKTKTYVQPSTSLMDNVPDWDAAQPATTTSNPNVLNVDVPKLKKEVEYKSKDKKSDVVTEKPKTKSYVQPSTSLMDNVPDWDAVQPATTTSNPNVLNVDVPKLKKEVEYKSKEKEKSDAMTEKPKIKTYVQPSTSLMDNIPDWDAAQPATTTSNPNVLNVDVPKLKKEVEYKSNDTKKSDVVTKKPKTKSYVQPSTSLMDNVPDWDAVQPATTTSNPNVLNVDVPKLKKEVEYKSKDKKSDVVTEKPKTKTYVQPSTSLMDNVPDWDAAQPVMTNSNPALVNVNVLRHKKKGNYDPMTGKSNKKKYVQPSTSLMDSAPDWDDVQSAITTSNPSVVNVDGINKIGKGKRLVRPFASSMDGETHKKTRPASADTPFEYKQVQSIPKENPAGAKPIEDEEVKTKLPAAIAHAAGSSSDGWTPVAHFPSDDDSSSPDGKEPNASASRKKAKYFSTMENYDQDALPRPTGVIPLTVSSSVEEKTQLFRVEHSLDPLDDNAENFDATDDALQKQSLPKLSSIKRQEYDDEQTPLTSKSSNKKLFLYDGGDSQPKEPWEFTIEGFDTKLDKSRRQDESKTEKKLVAYDRKSGTRVTSDIVENSTNKSSKSSLRDEKIEGSKADKNKQETVGISSIPPKRRTKLQEKTVSPFTRNVSNKDEIEVTRDTGRVDDFNKDIDSIDDETKDV